MKEGCKVYKRAGVVHVCFKGRHYAPSKLVDPVTKIDPKSLVRLLASGYPNQVIVVQGSIVEEWLRTVIGNDDPTGYAKSKGKPAKKAMVAKVRTEREKPEAAPTVPRAITWTKRGLPTVEEVDEQICAAAPNPDALAIMRVCWHNWFYSTVDGNRNTVPFAGLQWPDSDATERVRALGRKLAGQFKDTFLS
jgi:hypothetical protein